MMTKTNIPAGYKDSAVGIIPQEWSCERLGASYKLCGGYAFKSDLFAEAGIPIVRISNLPIDSNIVDVCDCVFYPTSEKIREQFVIKKGALLIAMSGATTGKTAVYNSPDIAYLNQRVGMFCPKNKSIIYDYLLQLVQSQLYLNELKPLLIAGAQPNIAPSDIENMKFPVPPMGEQRKIAEILGVWDEAIEKQSRLIEKLEVRKRALMQRLLTGRTRLPGFNTPWQKVKLGEICEEFVLRNTDDNNYIVLSCTKYNGLVSSLDYFGKQIFSDNLRTYKVVPKYHFAYATNHIEEGSIGYQGSYDYALISPMYTVFKADDTKVDNYFLYTLLKTPLMIYNYQSRIEGSIDRRGGLRWDAFAGIIIKLPSLPEQKAIAEVLTTADNEIATHRKKLDALRLQKRGLMQQLLTGKTRVKI